jgi:hypothetical protein
MQTQPRQEPDLSEFLQGARCPLGFLFLLEYISIQFVFKHRAGGLVVCRLIHINLPRRTAGKQKT